MGRYHARVSGQQPTSKPEAVPRPQPTAAKRTICPYCGAVASPEGPCKVCGGRLDPLSRQATQNAMGPWFIRDPDQPFRPGCSLSTIRDLARRGVLTPDSVVRGPSTGQFWSLARWTPGLSTAFGLCHACGLAVESSDATCRHCSAPLTVRDDRQHLGLLAARAVPGRPGAAPPPEASAPERVPPAAAPTAPPRKKRTRGGAGVWGVIAFGLVGSALVPLIGIPIALSLGVSPQEAMAIFQSHRAGIEQAAIDQAATEPSASRSPGPPNPGIESEADADQVPSEPDPLSVPPPPAPDPIQILATRVAELLSEDPDGHEAAAELIRAEPTLAPAEREAWLADLESELARRRFRVLP